MRVPAKSRPTKAPSSETALHMSVAGFIRATWPAHLPWWHTPMGGKREQRTRTTRDGRTVTYSPEAQKLRAMGALAGVPDLAFILPNGQIAFIELKHGDGQLSDEQIDFRQKAVALHCGYAVCRSLDEVEATLARWLSKFGLTLKGRLAA